MKRWLLVALACVALSVTTVQAGSDEKEQKKRDANTRSVQGSVSDSGDTLISGAVVQLKDTKSLQVRSFITKDDGIYHFHGLSPNVDYELRAEFQGASSAPKTLSSFDGRKIAVLNLKLQPKK